MRTKAEVPVDPGSIAFLVSEGFEGFRSIAQLFADQCEELPNIRGLFCVARKSLDPPQFLAKSTAARFRDTNPTIPIDELEKLWVPGAQVGGLSVVTSRLNICPKLRLLSRATPQRRRLSSRGFGP